ncbi:metallopeptidase family protein [Leucobacter sp. cx-42]|uniref:metallopeptidase family protein n=1 Tax=unclassified Leucobacter TaxID=2621730 RepID=UPI00165D9FDA|nr:MULTISPECIES: metallopeptidase family protein [unclassified Leucobacter]MBC9953917.1 metallopeptidase family protein [Leucobacter sp. cx-42]
MSHRDRLSRGVARRHDRRPIRSSMAGPSIMDPGNRVTKFERWARAVVDYLQAEFSDELQNVQIGFQTAPYPEVRGTDESQMPLFYNVNRAERTIVLYRMPIQRARGLHVDDEEHRRYFVEHCVYRAVCEYLGREPWELLPGRFEHF